jgi:glutathione synthase/RimK-type ligase-like ATP-grasp enzyme
MEILRKITFPKENLKMDAGLFGTYEELLKLLQNNKINYPCVIKKSAGAMSRGVFLANDEEDLIRKAKKISYTAPLTVYLKEKIRCLKHKGYKKESGYQSKFIIQPFIENLKNDWKVLIYGSKYFVLKRNVRKNDFRASGSGYNYSSGKEADFPENMLDFLKEYYCKLKVPNLSVDFAYDGKKGYIFEFQAIYFGTSTQYKSKEYYEEINGKWEMKPNNLDQEQIFVYSIVSFLRKYRLL